MKAAHLTQLITFLAGCVLSTCPNSAESAQLTLTEVQPSLSAAQSETTKSAHGLQKTLTGSYLASQFAQRRKDWTTANSYLSDVILHNPQDKDLLKRAMVLAAGSGDIDRALRLAAKIIEQDEKNPLANFFIVVDALKKEEFEKALVMIEAMPKGSLPEFIMPLLVSWAKAGTGVQDTAELDKNSVHIFHAIMVADFLKNHDHIRDLLKKAEERGKDSETDLEEIASIYAHIGDRDKALTIAEAVLKKNPENSAASTLIKKIKGGEEALLFPVVKSASAGAAEALIDMSQILLQQESDDSAQVFARLGMYLDPGNTEARLLMAGLAERAQHYSEAIEHFNAIPEDNENYLAAQRRSAELLEKIEDTPAAIKKLEALANSHKDPESLIKIGDIYREMKDFPQAIAYYNKAEALFGGKVPQEYWYIYYVRGMAFEQGGNWPKAEADLKAALEYEPDHPHVMNYLGYAWADKGMHLTQALDLIRRAVTLRPDDGYITDSLGWVYMKMGEHEKAMPYLERAVELLPYDPVINDHLGDVYWRVGRHLEARFQWQRARNSSEDTALIAALDAKLLNGITDESSQVKQAESQQKAGDTLKE